MAQVATALHSPNPQTENILAAARAAFSKGARPHAYQLAVEATEQDPTNIEAWLLRGWTAAGLEESLACLSRVVALDPQHPVAQQGMYQALQKLLEQDGFLAYVSESDAAYYIRTSTGLLLTVPKERAATEPFPPKKRTPLHRANRWLALAVLGLLPAGLGTFIFGPLALLYALQAQGQAQNRADRARAWIIVWTCVFLMCFVAVPLAILFLIHL